MGSHLLPALKEARHNVAVLVRDGSRRGEVKAFEWNPATGEIEAESMEAWKPEAVVHLAGKNIAADRWNKKAKEEIRTTRVEATDRLCQSLLNLPHPPRIFVSASAIGYYGDRGEELLDEESAPGTGFLPEVAVGWESAGAQMKLAGVRTVWLRFGMILSSRGGALAKMLPIFKAGAGGPAGSGRQWVSWISIEDAVRVILFCLEDDLAGRVNAVSPTPVRNRDFARALGRALHRPAVAPAPAFALRLAFGEMADALLLSSQRVVPRRLQEKGFQFRHSDLEACFKELLVAGK